MQECNEIDGYTVTIQTTLSPSHLTITLQSIDNAEDRYRSDFTKAYVEDMTKRTGNYKSFGVFVEMMMIALHRVSKSRISLNSYGRK